MPHYTLLISDRKLVFTKLYVIMLFVNILLSNKTMINRLFLARRASGMSLRELAEKTGNIISAQAINNYERGLSTPNPEVLPVLAVALGVSESYLALENNEISMGSVNFLMRGSLSPHEANRVSAHILFRLESYLRAENILGLPSTTWNKPWQAPWPVRHKPAEAEHAARELRSLWRIGLAPIANLANLLEEHGIKFLPVRLTKGYGFMAQVQRIKETPAFVVVANNQHWGDQQRFTMAQELSRLVLDVSPKVSSEAAANSFAGAFLMPAEMLRAEVGKYRTSIHWQELLALKRLFGVSMQYIIERCSELEIFSQTLAQKLFSKFRQNGWFQNEPYPLARECSERFQRLCWRAFEEKAIKSSEAATLLGKSFPEFIHLESEFSNVNTATIARQKSGFEKLISRRDHIATRIARKYGIEYKKESNLDIVAPDCAIAVETLASAHEGFKRLQDHTCPVYMVGIDHFSTNAIMNWLRNTDIGIMDPIGNILKLSTRRHPEFGLSPSKAYIPTGKSFHQRGRRKKIRETVPPVLFLPVHGEEIWKDYIRGLLRFNTSSLEDASNLKASYRYRKQRYSNFSDAQRKPQNQPTYFMRFMSDIRAATEFDPQIDAVLIVEQPLKLKDRIETHISNIPSQRLINVQWEKIMFEQHRKRHTLLRHGRQELPKYLQKPKEFSVQEEWRLLITFQHGLPLLNDILELGIGDCHDIFSIARKPNFGE